MSDSKIKFIVVELIKKGYSNTTSVECGLFKGIKIRSNGDITKPEPITFILIEKQEKEDSTYAFNLSKFNILSIGSKCDDTKELAIYKNDINDQEAAIKTLTSFFNALKKDKRVVKNDPEIIDIKSYSNLPGATKKVDSYYPHNSNNHGYSNQLTTWEKNKKEKELEEKMREIPTVFKREGKMPNTKVLNLMKKKISMISDGNYDSGIVITEEDTEEDAKKAGFLVG